LDTKLGVAVLARATEDARAAWGGRLVAAYALGSLAHGGFSALVSDVDLGLILADPLEPADADRVGALGERARSSGLPLGERLSVFWGSPASLRGEAAGGRFPAHDRLDLLLHGRLLAGVEARGGLPPPDGPTLIVESARFGLTLLEDDAYLRRLRDSAALVAAGPRPLTKAILFPIRFLSTARTGAVGRNHDAVTDFLARQSGPAADLAAAALRWREAPPRSPAEAEALVRAGLLPIYDVFLADYAPRLRAAGEDDLAARLDACRRTLGQLWP
jgi:predicted nucleotidyltransferase